MAIDGMPIHFNGNDGSLQAGEGRQPHLEAASANSMEVAQAEGTGQAAGGQPVPSQPPVDHQQRTEIAVDGTNVAHLPPETAIDDIRVEGKNLVLIQADGTEVVIVNGALHIPAFVIGDVALPQQAVIAALEQSGVDVAAGPDGTPQATAASGSHGNFGDVEAQGFGAQGPLASLLQNTDQADPTLQEADETFNAVPLITQSSVSVLTESGTDAGIFDQRSVTGIFSFEGGRDTGIITGIGLRDSVAMGDVSATGSHVALTSGGSQVTVSVNGLTVTGIADGQVVFTLTVDKASGAYTFTQFLPLDHPQAGASGASDAIRLQFSYTVTDKNGDAVTGNASIDIRDDAPTAHPVTSETVLSDRINHVSDSPVPFLLKTANEVVGGSGSLFHAGADGLKSIAFIEPTGLKAMTADDAGNPLQESLLYQTTVDKAGHTILSATGAISGQAVFTLSVADDGSYVFQTSAPLVHSSEGKDVLNVTIGFTATDGDGDTASGSLTVGVQDDVPQAKDVTAAIFENDGASIILHAGSDYDFGADGGQISFGKATISGAPEGLALEVPQIVAGKDGHSISISAGSNFDALAVGEKAILHIPYTVTDGDGDVITREITVTVNGTNDAPVAVAQTQSVVEDSQTSTVRGNLLSGATDVDHGATLSVASVAGQGDDTRGVGGQFGTLTWNAETGAYSYALDNSKATVQALAAGETVKETFTFAVTDEHHATSTQTLTVVVHGTNDAPSLTGDLAATVDRGQSYVLMKADLYFSDPDNTSVTFTASNLSHGAIYVDGSPATTFTSEQLAEGKVSFVQDGTDNEAASFLVSVEDGDEDHSAAASGTFNLSVTGTSQPPVTEHWTVITNARDGDTISIPVQALLWTAYHPDDGGLSVASVSGAHASLAGSTVSFAITSGSGAFDYVVSDGVRQTTATATVSHNWNTTGTDSGEIFLAHRGGDGSTVIAGLGNDALIGSADTAQNVLYGDGVTETVNDGSDLLIGGVNSTNKMFGGGGDDILIGATNARNHMDGGSGNDTLIGAGHATNELFGGTGHDMLVGGDFATNTMDGGSGNDTFIAGLFSVNNMTGGDGDDTFKLIQSSFNTVIGGDGKDILDFSRFDHGIDITLTQSDSLVHFDVSGGGLDYSGIEGIVGTQFDDVITGSSGNDFLFGGAGNDVISGGAGMNTLTGGAGADTFVIDASALSKLDPADVITDFNPHGQGDALDMSGLIDALIKQSGLNATEALGRLTAVVNDQTSETTISINTGSETHAVVTLQNFAPAAEAIKILYDHSEQVLTTTHSSGG